MSSAQESEKVFIKKQDEQILVVARKSLFPVGITNGLVSVDMNFYYGLINAQGEFIWRSNAETDERYKQVIPYLVFMYKDKIFVMQRKQKASEARLASKYSIGIGGHIRKEDLERASIVDWGLREFQEEVNYEGMIDVKPLGLLNDESNAVGRVHTGFVFLLKGDCATISVKSELQSGTLMSFDECEGVFECMESWSQIVFTYLRSQA